jgi:hypothetical protein
MPPPCHEALEAQALLFALPCVLGPNFEAIYALIPNREADTRPVVHSLVELVRLPRCSSNSTNEYPY